VGDNHILMQLDLAADAGTVRTALDTQAGIAAWWSTRTTLAGTANERRLEVSFPGVPLPFEFTVCEAPTRIEWVTGGFPPPWAGTTVQLDLGPNPDGPGTRLQFGHRDFAPDNPVIPEVTMAWAQILLRLQAYVETGQPRPFFDF
jgi:hypothetical protein